MCYSATHVQYSAQHYHNDYLPENHLKNIIVLIKRSLNVTKLIDVVLT